MSLWPVYTGGGEPHDGITQLPPPPPWRAFDGKPLLPPPSEDPEDAASSPDRTHSAQTYVVTEQSVELVNAALYLRRPLLVTGPPGSGKSSLPYAVARELMLGPVLRWNVTSRSTLDDALYQYDPLSRLYAAREEGAGKSVIMAPRARRDNDIADHLRLGPLGTALLPHQRPRALLIDEIDKGDLDLPNDLLNVLEEGQFEIPELVRTAHRAPEAHIMVAGADDRVPVHRGRVRCHAFPFVVLTSNGEREFPPAFLRRCVTLELRQPDERQLKAIVEAHLGGLDTGALELVDTFLHRASGGELATDQLLNAVYLTRASGLQGASRERLAEHLMPYLSQVLEPEGLRPDEF